MQKERDTPPAEQMEFQFDTEVTTSDFSHSAANNVVHVQFGAPKTVPLVDTPRNQALIDRILQSAQRLKW
jgi:hypothetical protein